MADDATDMKRAAAEAALAYVPAGRVLGVGSGTTAEAFIAALAASGIGLAGVVPSSERTGELLRDAGFQVLSLDDAGEPPVYIDGADEADPSLRLIKGKGGAFTREKIVATASDLFVCLVDENKLSPWLGGAPVPVEVLPDAAGTVAREIELMGGRPVLRDGFVTDNGNVVLDVDGLDLDDPALAEVRLDEIAGVVANGIFALRRADILIVGEADGGVDVVKRELG